MRSVVALTQLVVRGSGGGDGGWVDEEEYVGRVVRSGDGGGG